MSINRWTDKVVVHTYMEKAMAPHSSTLAWKIPWTEEPGRLQSMGSINWATSLSLFTCLHWRRKWQPTPVFLPGEFQGRRELMGCRLGVTQSWTRLKWLSSSSSNIHTMEYYSAIKKNAFESVLMRWMNLPAWLPAKSLQSCPTLCDPRDGSPPGSPVPGILQARTLEWVAISFSKAWK